MHIHCPWLPQHSAELPGNSFDWSQQELADKARIGVVTVRQLEAGMHEPRQATLDVVRRCFETAGIEFIDLKPRRRLASHSRRLLGRADEVIE